MSSLEYKTFPHSEYKARWMKAKKVMKREGFDALFITEPLNYHYFSGASPSFSYTRCNIIIFPREEKPAMITHEFVGEHTKRETWIEDVRNYHSLKETPVTLIKEAFEDRELNSGVIGCEFGFEQRLGLPYNDFLLLKKEMPKATFTDASNIFWNLRMIKSKAEAELLRRTCKITSEAYEECFDKIKYNMSEKGVERVFFNAIKERGGTNPWCFINSGPYNYVIVSGSPTNRKLKRGNTLWIDGGCTYEGYWSDFSRIAAIGPPTNKQMKTYGTALKLNEICLKMVKPGVRVSEIANACNYELRTRGLELTFRAGRIGHGIGLMLTEPPHVTSYDQTMLQPGMTITIEPGFITDYGVFQAEQNIIVTSDGHQILSTASTELKTI